MYEERRYRNLFNGIHMTFFDVCVKETDLCIGAVKNLYAEALETVEKYRYLLIEYIKKHPDFLTSLAPMYCDEDAPHIVKNMCRASFVAGVGPMAAVAGAFSELVGLELLKHSPEIIIENGGDIFLKSAFDRKVGIYAGDSPLNEKLCILIPPEKTPLGICTSSGTVGHSLSFGKSDAVVVISKDTFLADAVATATGNRVKTAQDIPSAIDFASNIEGILGTVIIVGDKLGVWGDVQLVAF